jgi:hypothetical protein
MTTTMDRAQELHRRPSVLPRRSDHVSEQLVDGEVVLYDSAEERIHALNATAAFVWHRCDGTRGEAEIVAELAGLYPEHALAIASDVAALISTLVSEGLLAS